MTHRKLPIAVLISGSGSTLKNLLEQIAANKLDAEVRLVISSRRDAAGIRFADEANIPRAIIRQRDYESTELFQMANFSLIRQHHCELVVMGGYLSLLPIPADFEDRVINIHPSLIPAFSGHGFYGLAVHQAAIEYGVKVSGCTVHFVDNEFDRGPIIAQEVCAVKDEDTASDLQARVGVMERQLLPKVIQAIAEGRIQRSSNKRTVVWSKDVS